MSVKTLFFVWGRKKSIITQLAVYVKIQLWFVFFFFLLEKSSTIAIRQREIGIVHVYGHNLQSKEQRRQSVIIRRIVD